MKWFFAITQDTLQNDPDHGFIDCIKVAVMSARKNTNLEPTLIFDGQECDFTKEMRYLGVNIIFHRITFYDKLHASQQQQRPEWPNYMQTAAGAFMRLDIPLIETNDRYALYTDCDVMFMEDPELDFCKPEIFAACGQFGQQDYYTDMNSGVMILNLDRIRNDYPALVEFMCDNFHYISGYDQELLRIFYNQNWSPLSAKYNWKPYWGAKDNAKIVHFHGPKAPASRKLLNDPTYREHDPVFHTWRHWFFQNPEGYSHYVPLWEDYLNEFNKTFSSLPASMPIADVDEFDQARI